MPESVATILKEAREEQNLSLREVAAALNIRYVYLQAIEDGEFGKLPGTTYAIGFLRSYADHIGLDSADLVNRFKADVAGLNRQTQLVFPTPVPEGKVPGGALILVSVLFLALAYGAWSYFSGQDEQVAEVVPVVPERLQDLLDVDPPRAGPVKSLPTVEAESSSAGSADSETLVGAPLQDAGEEAVSSQSTEGSPSSLETAPFETAPIGSEATVSAAGARTGPSGDTASASAAPAQAEATAVDPATPEAPSTAPSSGPAADSSGQATVAPAADSSVATTARAPAPAAIPAAPSTDATAAAYPPLEAQVYGRGNLNARIVLRATQDAWVQVRDSNEDLLFTRVLRAGDSYRVPNQAGLTLLTGNAGGLGVEVDGKVLGPLGPVGSVRRNVILEPDKLQEAANPGQ